MKLILTTKFRANPKYLGLDSPLRWLYTIYNTIHNLEGAIHFQNG